METINTKIDNLFNQVEEDFHKLLIESDLEGDLNVPYFYGSILNFPVVSSSLLIARIFYLFKEKNISSDETINNLKLKVKDKILSVIDTMKLETVTNHTLGLYGKVQILYMWGWEKLLAFLEFNNENNKDLVDIVTYIVAIYLLQDGK